MEERKIEFDIGFDNSRESAERIIYGIYGMNLQAFAESLCREAAVQTKDKHSIRGGTSA